MPISQPKHKILPVDIVLAPQWWHAHGGVSFDEDFFYNPQKRVETEQKMEQILYDRFGSYGLGTDKDTLLPQIGAVHIAAGFLLQEMLGCKVRYYADGPPQVVAADLNSLDIDIDAAFTSPAFKRFEKLVEALKAKYGYVVGDVNFSGILNLALDLRGQNLFLDMFDKPNEVKQFFMKLKNLIECFTTYIKCQTGTTSISVTRSVKHLKEPVFLHSCCSHTMLSIEDYQKHLMPVDVDWCSNTKSYGIHYCGADPHRFAEVWAKLPKLDFLDLGWGGDAVKLREYLPQTFFNIRLSPVDILAQSHQEIEQSITKLVKESANLALTGLCCINMDENVTDDKIETIFRTATELRMNTIDKPTSNKKL